MPSDSLLPPSLLRALAEPRPSNGLSDIKHVVFIMQENRSFDHYFGSLRGVRGYGDRNAVTTRAWKPIFEQDGVLPFSIREAAQQAGADPMLLDSHDHSWLGTQNAWAMGWLDAWVPNKGPSSMGFYDRRDLPFHYELADTFTVCDAYHCSLLSSTTPNRNYHISGYTGYEPGTEQRAIDNVASEGEIDDHPGYSWVTVPELLSQAGHSWQVYQEWDNYECNNLELFATFKAVMAKLGQPSSLRAFYRAVRQAEDPTPLLAALEEKVSALDPADRELYDRGLRRTHTGGLGQWFAADVAAGRLPAVSYIVTSLADCEHPEGSSAVESGKIIYQVLDALASHPDVWSNTAVFITYDENDGFFDHVPPPVPPDGTSDEFVNGRPLGLGMRVPMIAVSPWSVGGYVCSETFDHSSTVRFLETWLGIKAPDISRWRRTVAGDLTSAFDFGTPRSRPQVTTFPPVKVAAGDRWYPTVPAEQRMPVQEPGTKPARALPYQPDASARRRGSTLEITMTNGGTASAHMTLRGHMGELPRPQHFDVLDDLREVVYFPIARYDLVLTGPNGFRREFRGDLGDSVEVSSEINAASRTIDVTVTNLGHSTAEIEVSPLAYGGAPHSIRLAPGGSDRFSYRTTDGWYDFQITDAAGGGFARRLMGHIENGEESVTG
ncbi:phosphocholine-specific phospholipase C [Streptosporangium sp. NPDC000396]|uniref:phosphocholine-specific phospholipase C n=1 Tax=Streptosporangium sp. NPDC000396 TaxID=3366185 RepID=UPI0036B3FB3A